MTRRRRWPLVVVAAVLAVVPGLWLLDRSLERAVRAPIDAYLRARTLALVHSEESTALTILLPELHLSLIRRRLVLQDVRIRFERKDDLRLQQFEAWAPRVTLTGVDLTDILWRRSFRLAGVAIRAPVLRHLDEGPPDTTVAQAGEADTLPVTLPAPDSLLYRLVATWLPEEVRGGRIEVVRVERGTISSRLVRGLAITVDSTAGLSLSLRGLQLDSTRHRVFDRATLSVGFMVHATPGRDDSLVVSAAELTVTPDDTAFSIGEMHTGPPANRHALRAVGIRRSHARLMLTVDTVSWAPLVSDSVFFRAAPARSTRVRAVATGISILGLRQENLRRRRLTAGGCWIAGAELDVLADRRLPGSPGPSHSRSPAAGWSRRTPRPRVLWPGWFAGLDWVVGADSVVLESGRIRYAEWLATSAQPAAVTFDRLRVRLLRATNDSVVAAVAPLVINGRARLFGVAPIRTTVTVPVRTGPPSLRVEGDVGALPLASFNAFLLPANGLEITGGTLEHAAFRFDVAGGRSVGELRAEWRGLDLRLVDPVTGRQSLGKKLKSMVARMLTRNDNLPDKHGQLPAVPIRYEIRSKDTFWGLIWRSLRSGLVKAVRG